MKDNPYWKTMFGFMNRKDKEMKDDSLNDVQKELNPVNCPHGIAMDIYCSDCAYDDSFAKDGAIIGNVGMFDKMEQQNKLASKNLNVYEKEIWNAAIEAAAEYLERDNWITVPNQIRELKK